MSTTLSERHQDQFKTTLQFVGQSCWQCNTPATADAPLLACSRCQRVRYCGQGHQIADWKEHKKLCVSWAACRAARPTSDYPTLPDSPYPPSSKDLQMISTHFEKTLHAPLQDALEKTEDWGLVPNFLASREPRCGRCKQVGEQNKDSKLEFCGSCGVMAWCKEGGCAELVKDAHRASGLCSQLSEIVLDDAFLHMARYMNDDQRPGPIVPWAPDRVHTTNVPPLPTTFEDYLREVEAPAPEGHPLRRTMLEHALSLPLTILGALERFGLFPKYSVPKDDKTLTIHVLGAIFDYEPVAGGMALEEIMHYLPGVKHLKVFFIGPNLKSSPDDTEGQVAPEETCPVCTSAERTRTYYIEPHFYHDYLTLHPTLPPPDLAVAFNSGIHSPEHTATWRPTLNVLLANHTPSVFTSYTQDEAHADAEVVKNTGAAESLCWSDEANPWKGGRKRVDAFTREGVWGENAFWMGVWKKA